MTTGIETHPMTQVDQDKAKALFGEWFSQYPDIKNPSDINCQTKYDYFMKAGWENLQLPNNKGDTQERYQLSHAPIHKKHPGHSEDLADGPFDNSDLTTASKISG